MQSPRTGPGTPYPLAAALIAVLPLLAGCPPAGAEPAPQSGAELYSDCISCHGARGEGVAQFGAPAIAGLPAWYLEAQLRKFRGGERGSHVDDVEGLRMRPMSRQIRNERDLKEVSAYIASLPLPDVPRTLPGDPEAGKAQYQVCVACHAVNAMGNQALNAPPLGGQHDWYLVSQLRKFKTGVRGTAPGDVTGAQMRPMAQVLADEKAIHDVVAYISTLNR